MSHPKKGVYITFLYSKKSFSLVVLVYNVRVLVFVFQNISTVIIQYLCSD